VELALARLKRAGFEPQLVFDVGASYGLFVDEARSFWPNVAVHCFEPEPEYVEALRSRSEPPEKLRVCCHLVGASCADAVDYHFHLGASSILPSEQAGGSAVGGGRAMRSARMITLDSWCREQGVHPQFLKIDVQGYELEVLRGAAEMLAHVEVVLTEVNYIEIYRGVPLAAEVIGWLAARGYALHDVINFMPRPSDGALWQSDMVFVRHESAIRRSKNW
jgi:FkbM family methyltransferase